MLRVVNKRYHVAEPGQADIYIGRGSPLGNPATSIKDRATQAAVVCETAEESVAWYARWLEEKIAARDPAVCKALNHIWLTARVKDVNLVCYCVQPTKDKPCHGFIIKERIERHLPHEPSPTSPS